MTISPQPTSPSAQNDPNLRAVLRAGTALFLRAIDNITTFAGGDLRSGLVFVAIWTANMRQVTHSSANLEYGDTSPPDELLRPISVLALSESLCIPYETTRRHVEKLAEAGLCIRDGRGVKVAAASITAAPETRAMLDRAMPSLLLFLDELKRAQFDFVPYRQTLPGTVPAAAPGELPANARGLLRVSSEYMMHCIDVLGRLYDGDFLAGLIHTAIWMANVEAIRRGPENLQYGALPALPPDELRQPISVNALAISLRMPFETARRCVNRLLHEGLAIRVAKGLIVPGAVHAQPQMLECARTVHAHVVRLVADLHRAGFDFRDY
jgi:predicted transcriptional regulator